MSGNLFLSCHQIVVQRVHEDLPLGYISAKIPAATWAAFESVGALADTIQLLLMIDVKSGFLLKSEIHRSENKSKEYL